ncbi:MAG: WXG100 family type VII secretion target [Rhodococcus sp.]|uniref:WXG100 family type VII secretion target n=1 Tax=Rhodococcus TaxID=1827 RepID=UPI0016BB1741|nr:MULTISPECIES: WXG100 family type VII secretion target [Rhodococcus]NLV77795.1 WXG100 family type VII secretion target [Rhodococcus sp. (in: high G+C Gram-positive bacteria)]
MINDSSDPSAGGGSNGGQVTVDVTVMETVAAQLDGSREEFEDTKTALVKALADAQHAWRHDAAVTFNDVIVRWTVHSGKLTEALDDISRAIRTGGQSYDDTATEASTMIGRAADASGYLNGGGW